MVKNGSLVKTQLKYINKFKDTILNNSETTLNITVQPKDFCEMIDPIVSNLKIQKENQSIFQDDMGNKIFEKHYNLSNSDFFKDFNFDLFKSSISELISWYGDWLDLYKKSIEVEESKPFKVLLQSDFIYLEAQLNIFKNNSNYFIDEFELHYDDLIHYYDSILIEMSKFKVLKNDNDDFEFHLSWLGVYSYDIETTSSKIYNVFEFLRDSAGKLRSFCNEDLKMKAKIQLTRVKDPLFLDYLSHSNNNSIFNKSYFEREAKSTDIKVFKRMNWD